MYLSQEPGGFHTAGLCGTNGVSFGCEKVSCGLRPIHKYPIGPAQLAPRVCLLVPGIRLWAE